MKLKPYLKFALVVLPVTYLVLSFVYLANIRQFSIYDNDPPYCYLMNGTNLASGHFRVGIVEHPGTPVECFAATVIFIKHIFSGNTVLYQDVLLNSESYLFTCSKVLALLLALSTLWAGRYVFRHTGSIALALLFQSAPLFFGDIIKMTVSLSAESFITITGMAFMAYLFVNAIKSNNPNTTKNLLLFGLFSALLITTKIYCTPIILLVLFLIPSVKKGLVYIASTGLFTLVLLFPLYNQIRNFAGWVKSMMFHKGFYGKGDPGVINAGLYKNSLVEIFTKHYLFAFVFFLVVLSFIIALFAARRKTINGRNFLLPITGVLIFFIAFILIIAKQYIYYYPSPLTHQTIIITKFYYFIMVFMCFPLAIVLSYKVLSPYISTDLLRTNKQWIYYIGFSILIVWGGQQAYASSTDIPYQNVLSDKTRPMLDIWKDTPLIIVTDGFKVCPEEAYFLGISYSGRWDAPQYFDFMKKTDSNTYLYTTYNDALCFWNEPTDISTILKKKRRALIYLNGTDSAAEETILARICDMQLHKNTRNCRKIYSSGSRYEEIYLLQTDTIGDFK